MANKLHHKLNDAGNSIVGNNPSPVGTPLFTAGDVKFGKGIANPTGSAGLNFGVVLSQAELNDKWAVGFFWQPLFNSSDGTAYSIFTCDDQAGYRFAHAIYNQVAGKILIWIASDGETTGRLFYFDVPAWTANDILHIGITCDNTQLNTDGIKLKINNVTCPYAGTYAGDNTTAWNFTDDIVYRISGWFFGSYNSNIDNVFIWNTAKTDFSGYLWEDFEGIPVNVSASQGTYTNKITISWDTVVGDNVEYNVYRSLTSGGSATELSGWQTGISYDDTAITPGNHYFYTVYSRTSSATSSPSAECEGYATGVPALPVYRPQNKKMSRIEIFNSGIDIFKLGYVEKSISIIQERSFSEEKTYVSNFDIPVNNNDLFFSSANVKSIFYGMNKNTPIKIYDPFNNLIFSGIIESITRDYTNGRKATLNISDLLYKNSTKNVVYQSATWETPAQAFENICKHIGFTDYDTGILTQSHGAYINGSCYIKVNVNASEPVQFQTIIEKLGDIGVASVYVSGGVLFFRHWIQKSVRPTKIITKNDMINAPIIYDLSDSLKNDYSIIYSGSLGLPTGDIANNNIGNASRSRHGSYIAEAIDGGESSQVIIKDLASAKYIGETIIKRSNIDLLTNPRPITQVDISVRLDSWYWINLETYIGITLDEEGWSEKTFEVIRVEKNEDQNTIDLSLIEVQE